MEDSYTLISTIKIMNTTVMYARTCTWFGEIDTVWMCKGMTLIRGLSTCFNLTDIKE